MIPILEISQSLLCNSNSDNLPSSEKMTKTSPSHHPADSNVGTLPKEQLPALEERVEGHRTFQLRSVEIADFVEAIQMLQGREKLETD